MAEATKARVTIINQKEGKLVLPPCPDELKKDPKAKNREVPSGHSIEVSTEEGARLMNHKGILDAAKAVPAHADQLAALKKQLAAASAENARLAKLVPAPKKADKDA